MIYAKKYQIDWRKNSGTHKNYLFAELIQDGVNHYVPRYNVYSNVYLDDLITLHLNAIQSPLP